MPNNLISVAPGNDGIYRVARRSSDVFAPPDWQYAREDGTFGGRFDDPSLANGNNTDRRFRMIYCASNTIGAFGETLAQFRISLATLTKIREDVRDDEESFADSLGKVVDPHNPSRRVLNTSEWCSLRHLGHTFPDDSLQFVDIMAAESLAHLRDQPSVAQMAVDLGLDDIDIHAVTGPHRALTQICARYIYEQTDTSGNPQYGGLRYLSHYGAGPEWECWAIFNDRILGQNDVAEIAILPDAPGLLAAARIHGITLEVAEGVYRRP